MKKEEDPDWKAYADPEKKRKKKDPNQKKKKQPVIVKKQDDLIDSDNEINALIPQSTESQTSTSKLRRRPCLSCNASFCFPKSFLRQ